MNIKKLKVPISRSTISADRAEQAIAVSQEEFNNLRRKYEAVLKQRSLEDRIIEVVRENVSAYRPVRVRPRLEHHKPHQTHEAAVLVLSDTHIGKKVYASQTLGFGNYDFRTFADRLYFLEDRVRCILARYVVSPIDRLVVFLLGDILDGQLAHAKEIVRSMTLFDQFYAGAHCIAQMLRNISQDVPRMDIYAVVGNHTRMPNQHKMPTEQRYSNFDLYLCALVKEMLGRQPNIFFHLDYQPFCYVDIKGTKVLGMHGDHIRGGDKAMGLPIHGISRTISGITQMYESRNLEAPHLWLSGHLHRTFQLPTVKGEWLINGAFPGDDNYSLSLATSAEPMQLFFGVHPKYRKTWEYKLKLIHATPHKVLPYELPPGIEEMLV